MKPKTDEGPRNINDIEITLIQAAFENNEALLKVIRALFLGLEISQRDRDLIKDTFANDALRKVMWRRFYPTMDRETPIGQVQDIWLGAEEMVYGASRDTIYQAVHYKQRALDLTEQALKLLEDPSGPRFDAAFNPNHNPMDDLQVALLARNQFIRHVEKQLLFLWLIAEQKTKSPKEIQERIEANSTR